MKTLYLECNMGAAGDMLTAALFELLPDPDAFLERLNGLGIPGVAFRAERTEKCGIAGTHMSVSVDGREEESAEADCVHDDGHTHGQEGEHRHTHHGLAEIEHIVSGLDLPQTVRDDVLAVYRLIAEAESHVHGKPVDEIHFHEVGTLDAVADVTAVCLLMHEIAPDVVTASPIYVGSGQVRCAHGILPVPAPATAYLLRGIPTCSGEVQGELCTPTGAALLRYFAESFGGQPQMRVEQIGYGCGKKDFDRANCVRAFLGESDDAEETVIELACNLDDMTPEAVGFAMEALLQAGALDVYTTPIGMKKDRPAVLFTCMCRAVQREEMIRLLFLHTTTLGIREAVYSRYTLKRSEETVETKYGPVRIKKAGGWGVTREKPEYEDLASIARKQGISIEQVIRELP